MSSLREMKKLKNRKIKIIKIEFNDLSMGFHFLGTNIIIINKHLDKFPKLKKKVIQHEKKHFEEKTIYKAIIRDWKDAYEIYSTPEFFEFKYFIEHETPSKKDFYEKMLYNFSVYPVMFCVQFFCELRFIFKNIKKLRLKNGKNKDKRG